MTGPQGKNDKLIELAGTVAAAVKDYNEDPRMQRQLLKQVDNLRLLLESPMDPIFKQWEMMVTVSAMNLLVESGALDGLPHEGSITSTDLAALVEVEESAINRAFKVVVLQGICEETAPNTYAHNAKSIPYTQPGPRDLSRFAAMQMNCFLKLPEYFKTHSNEDLLDLKKSPFAWSFGLEGLTYYEAISHDPDRFQVFNATLKFMEHRQSLLGMFPFASLKDQVEAEPDRAFIVDIGGGTGQSLLAIQKEAPKGFGAKMILQDRPDVINSLQSEDIPDIKPMVYDFFTPQPIKNAHIYLLRQILHDFYEPVNIQILKHIVSAMGPTSRLIIADRVMPERANIGGDATIHWMDFTMMCLNGKEKSEKEFREITDAVGLEIVKIWYGHVGSQAHLECRLKARC